MSVQLDTYLHARTAGLDPDLAAEWAGIPFAEAVLIEKDIARREIILPPPRDHNQSKEEPMTQSIEADELRLLIERVERLEEEKQAIADDIKEVYAEAKSRGYDTKTMRECVKLRKMETHVRQEREALLDTYKAALGLDYAETPLGRSVMERVADQINAGALGEGVTATVHGAH
jgi:uncharacterized protein (UPF0335 family)